MGRGRFGTYRVEGRVGVGATSTVWKAEQPDTARVVAIKELDPSLVRDPVVLQRLRTEARILASFDHPNIVRIYDFVEEPDSAWIVEEWIDGAGLDAVAAHGPLRLEQALAVLHGALTGLAFAHAGGVVHGDVKPANVLVDQLGTSKLVDFGLARTITDDALAGGSSSGTPGYAAPELAAEQATSPTSDVYSAGVLLYELLTGERLFGGDSPPAVLVAQRGAIPNVPGAGAAINDLIRRATAVEPTVRPPDAGAFLAELERAADDRCGAGWLAAGSVASLAAATSVAAITATGTPTGAGVGSGSPTVVTQVVRVRPSRGRLHLPKKWVLAGVAGTIVLVGGGAAVAIASGSDDTSKSRPASTTSTEIAATAISLSYGGGRLTKSTCTPVTGPACEPVTIAWEPLPVRCTAEGCTVHMFDQDIVIDETATAVEAPGALSYEGGPECGTFPAIGTLRGVGTATTHGLEHPARIVGTFTIEVAAHETANTDCRGVESTFVYNATPS